MGVVLEVPSVEEISAMGAGELESVLVELERVRRRVEGATLAVLDRADASRVWADDRHGSVRGWALALTNVSGAEMRSRLQTMRAVRDLGMLGDGLRSGEVGVCQARQLAAVHANPRVREALAGSESLLVGHASGLRFEQFRFVCRHWESLADPDGARRGHDEVHAGRHADVVQVGDEYRLTATGGTGQGVSMEAVFAAFCEAEFDRDWASCRDRFGDAACVALMDRTAAQRRFDALHQVFVAAAEAAPEGVRVPEPLVTIVVDQATFDAHVAEAAGATSPAPDPATVDERRCATVEGVRLDPRDVVAAAVVGHVRRAVLDAAGVTINLGRKQRLFTGSSRIAAMVGGRRCLWPGCRHPRTQLDHRDEWAGDHGATDQDNTAWLCGPHNRWKHHGYTVTRDPDGVITIMRPDGTALTEPRAA